MLKVSVFVLVLSVFLFASCNSSVLKDSSDSDVHVLIALIGEPEKPLADYKISADGVLTMPMKVDVTMSGPSVPIVRIWGEYKIEYKSNNRNDTFAQSVELRPVLGSQSFSIDMAEARGGILSLTVFASIRQQNGRVTTDRSKTETSNISAESPTKTNVRNLISDELFTVLIFQRSKFEQFDANGLPIFDKGFGLYRIESPTVEQIWNWKKNLEFGKQDLAQRSLNVKKIPEKLRMEDPVKYADLPDFNESQLALEAIQSYGTGQYHKPEKSLLTRKWKWVEDKANDGFASKCKEIAKDVKNGNVPAGWN